LIRKKEVSAAPQKKCCQPLASTFDESYYRSKAAYVWWMLRDMVGDDALKLAISRYRTEDDKDKGPKYVEQLIESAAQRDLACSSTTGCITIGACRIFTCSRCILEDR